MPALVKAERSVQGKRRAVSCAERRTCTSEGRRTIVGRKELGFSSEQLREFLSRGENPVLCNEIWIPRSRE